MNVASTLMQHCINIMCPAGMFPLRVNAICRRLQARGKREIKRLNLFRFNFLSLLSAALKPDL